MYEFQLSRKAVISASSKDLLGYNYYVSGYNNGELLKSELIYSSLATPKPLDLMIHDLAADTLYTTFLKSKDDKNVKTGQSCSFSMSS